MMHCSRKRDSLNQSSAQVVGAAGVNCPPRLSPAIGVAGGALLVDGAPDEHADPLDANGHLVEMPDAIGAKSLGASIMCFC